MHERVSCFTEWGCDTMDFGKVKTLLIIVFFALNLFLVDQWWTLQNAVGIYQEPYSDQLANVRRSLASHHVLVKAIVPSGEPAVMTLLAASHMHDTFKAVAASALQLQPSQVISYEVNAHEIRLPSAVFIETQSGVLQLVFSTYGKPTLSTRFPILDQLKRWLALRAYHFGEYKFIRWEYMSGHQIAVFDQQMDGYCMFNAQLKVTLMNGRILGYSQKYISVIPVQQPRSVISAANALLAVSLFMDKAQVNEDNTIRSVVLGYDSPIQLPKVWILTPVWWIQSDLGTFQVNAFTGEVGVGEN